MHRYFGTILLLLTVFSGYTFALDLNVATAGGALNAGAIKLTINGNDFDPELPESTGMLNYDLPERGAILEKGLRMPDSGKGLIFYVTNFDNRPWTFSVGPGLFMSEDGQTPLDTSSLALFMVTFAGTFNNNTGIFLMPTDTPSIAQSIQTPTFLSFATETPAYISGTVDTNHGTLGQAQGFSNGTEISVQLALNLSPLQPAGTYTGSVTFKVEQ